MTIKLLNTLKRQNIRRAMGYGSLWLLFTLWLRLCLPESLMGWERHQLFRFSAEYLTFFSTKPYPILQYVQAFFTQFYLYPLLGAAVVSGLLTLGIGAWHNLTGRYWTGLVWAAFMLPAIPYFNLLWVLVWLVLLGGAVLIDRTRLPTGGRLGLTAGLTFIATFILQENVVFALVFWSLIGGLRARSGRHGLYGLTAGALGAAAGLGLMAWQGYPFCYTQYMTQWPLIKAELHLISGFPSMFFICPPFIRIWTYIGLAVAISLPATVLLPVGQPRPTFNIKRFAISKLLWRYGLTSLAATLLLLAAAYLNLHYQAEDFYLVDRLGGEARWAEAADAAELAFFQRARPEAAGSYHTNFLHGQTQRAHTTAGRLRLQPAPFQNDLEENYMADMLKICLLGDRQSTNKLFAYNGSYYFPLLFPEEIQYSPSSYLITLYYTQNGLYAEALHIFYDFVTSQRISTAVLEPLLWNSVVVGDYTPCRKFIRLFEQSLFHKDIARRYTTYINDTIQTARKPNIAAARTQLSVHNHTVLGYQPDDNIHFRLQHEADNAAVYEYALTLWMVYKNHGRILAELPKIRRYYKILPIHIQEAVLANFPADRLDEVPDDLHPSIKARYAGFLQTYTLYRNGYTSFEKLKKNFEDTYWYHLYFNDFKPINPQPSGKGGEI